MYIKNLILRNFKSFKSSTIRFDGGFNAVVGPNGSGKSNVIDSVQFAFGENRVRALRAKKTSDLIFSSARIGEVEMELADDAGNILHKVSRAIRNDGKTKYKLDGKVSKKYVIDDFLASNHLGSHNIIQQGQVQQIVEMSSKDRRGLIDIIANVAEYEDKKREAISKLDDVQQKLRDASSILAEREGYMEQLRSERDDAELYVRLKRELDSVKATLLSMNVADMQSEFDAIIAACLDSTNRVEVIAGEISILEKQITECGERKRGVDDEIVRRSEGRQLELQREIDDLNNKITIAKAVITDKKDLLTKSDERRRTLELDATRAADEVRGLSGQAKQLEEDLASLSKLLATEQESYERTLADSNSFSKQFHSAKKSMDDANNEMLATKEKLNAVQAESAMVREKQKLKFDEIERLRAGRLEDFSDHRKNLSEGHKEHQREIAKLEGELDALFKQEKECNERLKVLDDLIMLSKEKVVEIQTRLRTVRDGGESRSLESVLALRQKEPSILGTVDQLCKYDSDIVIPVQVAIGQRANYLIVEDAKTATSAIEYLKREGGRASFIPLDKIHSAPITQSDRELAKHPASKGFLIDFLEFDPSVRRAFEYVCGNTLLVTGLREARDLVGKIRFVTQTGDLGEASGLLTGGKTSAPKINLLKEQAELEDYSHKLENSKAEKDSTIRNLSAIQLQSHELRKRKAEAELKQRAIKLELDDVERKEKEQEEKSSNLTSAVRKLEAEMRAMDEEAAKKDEERSALIRKLSELNLVLLENKQKVDVEKEEIFGTMLKEKERKIGDLKISSSDLSNRLSALSSKKSVYEKQHSDYQKQLSTFKADEDAARKAMTDAEELIRISRDGLEKKIAEQKEIAGALKGLYDARDELDREIQKLGNTKGKKEFERDKITSTMQEKSVKKAVIENKLAELRADFAAVGEVALIEGSDRTTLESKRRELEPKISEMSGRVNMRAIDDFSKRLAEFEEQKANVLQLSKERESVMFLINEIEGRKVSTFMNAFNLVNDNFGRLFTQLFKGNGRLVLENEANPFEGGLTIEVRLTNKEVKYLELMSGGEKSLVAILFLFALQAYNPSSIYILDEADAALDQENSRMFALLVSELSKKSQFLVISHNQTVYKTAQCLVGVTMTKDGSKIVEVKLQEQGQQAENKDAAKETKA